MTDRTFDRLVQFDERSRNFPIRTVVAKKPRSYTWRIPGAVVLDQGSEGACVGHAWAHEIGARPVTATTPTSELAFDIYREAQKIDEWPGESYSGTSVLAGAKIVQQRGHIDQYRWAFGLDDLILAVGYAGPAVLGVNWYEGMFQPDADGFIQPTGQIAGGHAIVCRGVSVRHRRFLLTNSWGDGWGNHGDCHITFDDMARLLDESGEACIPGKRRKVAG